MKEFFIVTPGNLYHDPQVEEMNLYYNRQLVNLSFMLAGGICLIYAMIGGI